MSPLRPTLLALALGVLGCSTVGGVQEAAPDAGQYQQFPGTLSATVGAAEGALHDSHLQTTGKSQEGDSAWVIVATHDMSFNSSGEIVRIRMVRSDSVTTRVWIHTKRRMAINIFGPGDWSKVLFAAMGQSLGSTHTPLDANYRLLLADGQVRVLDVQILPGDTTLFHTHDAVTLFIPIMLAPTDAEFQGGQWGAVNPEDVSSMRPGAVELDTLYATDPVTHRVTNVGASPFRVIEVTNGGPGAGPGRAPPERDLPGVLELSSSWFRQSRLAVSPGVSTVWYASSAPLVLVQAGTGNVSAERTSAGAGPSPLNAPGDWVYIPAGMRYRLRNGGEGSSDVVIVQVR